MNENIGETTVDRSEAESNEQLLAKEFIRRVVETRGGILGISKKKASEIIKTIPNDVLEQSLPELLMELKLKISEISTMPPMGGMPAMGDAIRISNIRTFIESIEEKLKRT